MTTTGYRASSSRRSCSASDSEAETTAAAQAPSAFFWRATPFSSEENGVAYRVTIPQSASLTAPFAQGSHDPSGPAGHLPFQGRQ